MKPSETRSDASLVTRHRHVATKRVLDTAAVVFTAPVTVPIALATALAVRAKLGGPVVFKQTRVGLDERPFTLMKFRSMLPETNEAGARRTPAERITRFGALLRKSSLDELPQLWNVLRGDMALVGPRPLLPEYLPFYTERERLRHSVRPGITGLAQISGRNELGWDERLGLDATYAEEFGPMLDAKLLLSTVSAVFARRGLDHVPGAKQEYLHVERGRKLSDGLRLRDLSEEDLETRVEWFNHPELRETLLFDAPITIEGTKKWFTASLTNVSRSDLVAEDPDTGQVLCMLGYRVIDDPTLPEFYIAVGPGLHGKGIGQRSLRLLLERLRRDGNTRGTATEMYRANPAVVRICEKVGMREVQADLSKDRMRMEVVWS